MLVLALLFPIGLMVFNPTLMFERGWEQYVGTGIYFWAVLTLEPRAAPALAERTGVSTMRRGCSNGVNCDRLAQRAARGRSSAPRPLIPTTTTGILPVRVRQLVSFFEGERAARR